MQQRAGLILAAGLTLLMLGAGARASAAETTIRMWTFLNPHGTSPREVALAEIIGKFEKANPDIKVNVEPQVWDQMSPKFLAAAHAGSAPDVTWIVTDMLGAVKKSGELADLQPLFIDKWPAKEKASREDAYWKACRDGAKQECLVLSRNYIAILYRKDLLREAGIDPKTLTTWPAFIAAAQKLTTRNASGQVTRWGFGQAFSVAQADPQMMIPIMLGEQGSLFTPDGHPAFATKAGIAALQQQVDMVTKYKVTPPDAINWTVDDTYEAFAAGKAAMIEGASVRIPTMQAKLGADNVGLMLWPGEVGKPHSPAMAAGWAVGAWSHGHHLAAAAKFVDFLTGPTADAIWVQVAGQMPMTEQGRAASAAFLAKPQNQYLAVAADGVAHYSWLVPTNISANGFRQALNRAAQAVLAGKATPKEALLAAEHEFDLVNHVK